MSTQLESWNNGATKSSIMEFVTKVTTEKDPDYLPPTDRIATFDNDGTLWVEVPAPPQSDSQIRKWIKEAHEDPSLASKEPYKAILEQDKAFFEALAIQEPTIVASVQEALARSCRHNARSLRCRGTRVDLDRQAAEVRDRLYKTHLHADARAVRLSQGSRLPSLRVLQRWPGLHMGVLRDFLGRREGERNRHRSGVRVQGRKTPAHRSDPRRSCTRPWQTLTHFQQGWSNASLGRRKHGYRYRDV